MALTNPQKLGIAAVGAVGVIAALSQRRSAVVIDTPPLPVEQVKALIKSEAKRQGVSPKLALTFADLESRFKSNVVGDKGWPFRGGRWERFVRDNPKYAESSFRLRRELWVSYGLFQLLSPFELWRENPNGDPRLLADPATNVRLGVAKMKRLQDRFGNDPLKIRLAYGGCTVTGRKCDAGTVLRIARKLAIRARVHGLDLGEPSEVVARAQALAAEFA